MDIERLKELKQQVFDSFQLYEVKMQSNFDESMKMATPIGEMDDDGKDLTALIDEAISRQSQRGGVLSDMAYKTTIHNAKEELPLKSGTYLVKTSDSFNIWQVLGYSIKFKKFNTYDSQDNDKDAINGYMWAELPEEGLSDG